jgi:hypothetical protein
MRDLLQILTNRNARWRFTHSIFFKLGTGCLGLLFILACLGTLLVIYFFPTR